MESNSAKQFASMNWWDRTKNNQQPLCRDPFNPQNATTSIDLRPAISLMGEHIRPLTLGLFRNQEAFSISSRPDFHFWDVIFKRGDSWTFAKGVPLLNTIEHKAIKQTAETLNRDNVNQLVTTKWVTCGQDIGVTRIGTNLDDTGSFVECMTSSSTSMATFTRVPDVSVNDRKGKRTERAQMVGPTLGQYTCPDCKPPQYFRCYKCRKYYGPENKSENGNAMCKSCDAKPKYVSILSFFAYLLTFHCVFQAKIQSTTCSVMTIL